MKKVLLFVAMFSTAHAHHENVYYGPNESTGNAVNGPNALHFAYANSKRWAAKCGPYRYFDDPIDAADFLARCKRGDKFNLFAACTYGSAPAACSPSGPNWSDVAGPMTVLKNNEGNRLGVWADKSEPAYLQGQFGWVGDVVARSRSSTCPLTLIDPYDDDGDAYVHHFNWMTTMGDPTVHMDNANWDLGNGDPHDARIVGGAPDGSFEFIRTLPQEDFCWQHPHNDDPLALQCAFPAHYHELFPNTGIKLRNQVNYHITDYTGTLIEANCFKFSWPI